MLGQPAPLARCMAGGDFVAVGADWIAVAGCSCGLAVAKLFARALLAKFQKMFPAVRLQRRVDDLILSAPWDVRAGPQSVSGGRDGPCPRSPGNAAARQCHPKSICLRSFASDRVQDTRVAWQRCAA
eukprot:327396-Pyramimonas_sp.AAC.1